MLKCRPTRLVLAVLFLGMHSLGRNVSAVLSETSFPHFTSISTNRTVVGSLGDVSIRYDNDRQITIIHMLDFGSDMFPGGSDLLQVRLCGNQQAALEPFIHTNLLLTFNLASPSRLTGCLRF